MNERIGNRRWEEEIDWDGREERVGRKEDIGREDKMGRGDGRGGEYSIRYNIIII